MSTPTPTAIIAAATAAMDNTAVTLDKTIAGTGAGAGAAKPDTEKSYQFPSAPTTFEFTHSAKRVAIPDGVYKTSDTKEVEELDKCVRAGIIYDFIDPSITPFAKPAAPLNPSITN